MSLEWPAVPPGGFRQSSLSPSPEDPNDGHMEDAHLALPLLRWRRDAVPFPANNEFVRIGTRVSIFLTAAFDVLLGIREGLLDSRVSHNLPGKESTTTSLGLPRTTTSSVSKKVHGKDEGSRLLRYWPRDSGYMVSLFRIM